MKQAIIFICLFINFSGEIILCETSNLHELIFQTKENIHGPVKTIITTITQKNASNSIELKNEYLPDGRIKNYQFFDFDLDEFNIFYINVSFCYNGSKLAAIEYYVDGDIAISSKILTSNEKIFIYQNVYKSIFNVIDVDYNGRLLFDLLTSWNRSIYWYQIELQENGWRAIIYNINGDLLFKVFFSENIDRKNYLIYYNILRTSTKLELLFSNGNLIHFSLFDIEAKEFIMQKKYEYTSYDRYGNWLECVEESDGIETIIFREILFY